MLLSGVFWGALTLAVVCVLYDLFDARGWPKLDVRPSRFPDSRDGEPTPAADAQDQTAERPTVTVVVPVYNDFDTLAATIESILPGLGTRDSLIVVDDGSTAPEAEAVLAALEGNGHRVLRIAHAGKHAAVMAGCNVSDADILVIVDADTRVPADFLTPLCARFLDPEVLAVDVIPKVANPSASLWTRLAEFERGLLTIRPTSFGALFAIRTTTLAAMPMRACRSPQFELDLRLKQGNGLRFVSEPLVYSMEPTTLRASYRRKRRWILGMLQGLGLNGLPIPYTLYLCVIETLLCALILAAPWQARMLLPAALVLGAWLGKSLWLGRRYRLRASSAVAYPLYMLVLAAAATDALVRYRLGLSSAWR